MKTAIILGAGPAGATAAALLASRGVAVTLVEQSRFPRDKVCGECLSAVGIDVLDRLGDALPRLRDRGALPLRRAILHADGTSLSIDLPRAMLGISRGVLDVVLRDLAVERGATLVQPARCEKLEPGPTPRATVRCLLDNRIATLEADLAIVADGKSALLGSKPAATDDLGLKTHFAGVRGPADAIELFSTDGHYGGLAPIEGGRWNAAFSVPRSLMLACRGDGDAVLARMLRDNPTLACRLAGATRVGDWLASPLPRFLALHDWPAGVVPVGNAAAAIEPVGGEGMGLALRSAELAADAILAARGQGMPLDIPALQRAYRSLWRTRSVSCRAVARLLSSPTLAEPALALASAAPALTTLVTALLGKRRPAPPPAALPA